LAHSVDSLSETNASQGPDFIKTESGPLLHAYTGSRSGAV
jgi:hypothetical protein